MKLFPIMAEYGGYVKVHVTDYIPWEVIAGHEKQAMTNHGQTLERLAERGGLDYTEALAVLEDRKWTWLEQSYSRQMVFAIVINYGKREAELK